MQLDSPLWRMLGVNLGTIHMLLILEQADRTWLLPTRVQRMLWIAGAKVKTSFRVEPPQKDLTKAMSSDTVGSE